MGQLVSPCFWRVVFPTAQQLFGALKNPPPDAIPTMNGFVFDYATVNNVTAGGGPFIMKCFDPSHVPVMYVLRNRLWGCCPD